MKILVRPMIPEDRNFILATWLRSYRNSPFTKYIPSHIYFEWHQRVIERIWARPTARTLIACLEEDPMVILGYLAFESQKPEVLHFCYVKETLEGNGIAKTIFKEANISMDEVHHFTHFTKPMETLSVKYRTLRFDPYKT